MLKKFFFGPRGGSGPLCLVPGSVPETIRVALEANCNLKTVKKKKKNLVLGLGQWTSNLAYWDGRMKSKAGKK